MTTTRPSTLSTVRATYERASRLGVAHGPGGRRPTWTDADNEILREWLRRAATALGRSEHAIAARAQRLAHRR